MNHASALTYPTHVSKFLRKEVELGAMCGPFNELSFKRCHVSPLTSRPKDEDVRRIIVDLSFGEGDSVNGCTPRGVYDGKEYVLTLPSLDYLLADILKTNNPRLIKIDIEELSATFG